MAKPKKLDSYVVDFQLSQTGRTAHFLNWAADYMPGEWIAYNQIVKATGGYKTLPPQNGKQVDLLKGILTGVRKHLVGKYNRELVSMPGIGVRATVDHADRLKNVAPVKARRLDRARQNFLVTATGIDLAKVPNTPEYAQLKRWMGSEIGHVLKTLNDPAFARRLLPPGAEPATPEKDAK